MMKDKAECLAFDTHTRQGRCEIRYRPTWPEPAVSTRSRQQFLSAKLPAVPEETAAREGRGGPLRPNPWCSAGRRTARERRAGSKSAWAQYTIRLPDRDAVAVALGQQGIPTAVYYPKPLHLQPAYERFGKGPGSLPISERLARQVLSLPMHADLDEATAARIAGVVRDAVA